MRVVRPAAPATGTLRCWLRSDLDVATATPSALVCQTPCLPASGCAGPRYKRHLV